MQHNILPRYGDGRTAIRTAVSVVAVVSVLLNCLGCRGRTTATPTNYPAAAWGLPGNRHSGPTRTPSHPSDRRVSDPLIGYLWAYRTHFPRAGPPDRRDVSI